jgi:hypothetical protein
MRGRRSGEQQLVHQRPMPTSGDPLRKSLPSFQARKVERHRRRRPDDRTKWRYVKWRYVKRRYVKRRNKLVLRNHRVLLRARIFRGVWGCQMHFESHVSPRQVSFRTPFLCAMRSTVLSVHLGQRLRLRIRRAQNVRQSLALTVAFAATRHEFANTGACGHVCGCPRRIPALSRLGITRHLSETPFFCWNRSMPFTRNSFCSQRIDLFLCCPSHCGTGFAQCKE